MTSTYEHRKGTFSIALISLLVGVAALSLAGMPLRSPSPSTGQAQPTPTFFATSTPSYPRPIFTAAEAISRSLELFPPGGAPQNTVARNISHRTFGEWLDGPAYWEDRDPWQPGEFHPDHPVWLVGILGNNLTDNDIIAIAVPGEFLSPPAVPVPGAFYAFDANSGLEAGFGALTTAPSEDFASIAALPTEAATVVPATEVPRVGAPSPTP